VLDFAKSAGAVLFVLVIMAAVAALLAVFIKGSLWASENLLSPLIAVGWLALAVVVFVLLPLSLFRRLRPFTGTTIFLSSFIFGLIAWLLGFVLAYALWGVWAVIVGILFFGGGVVPIALLATLVNGLWAPFFTLLVLTIITFGSRGCSSAIAKSAE
jgi:hypothetical protein